MSMTAKMAKRYFQSPIRTAACTAMTGARNEAIALMNCPRVSTLGCFSWLTRPATRGFNETCIKVLPMPISEKATTIAAIP